MKNLQKTIIGGFVKTNLLLLLILSSSCFFLSCDKEEIKETVLTDENLEYTDKSRNVVLGENGELIGTYDNQLNFHPAANANATAMKTADIEYSGRITLYEKASFKGRNVTIYGPKKYKGAKNDWLSKIGSMIIPPGCGITFFDRNNKALKQWIASSNQPFYKKGGTATFNTISAQATQFEYSCTSSSGNNFIGNAYTRSGYTGEVLPLYESKNGYTLVPSTLPGWGNLTISSVAMNRHNDDGSLILNIPHDTNLNPIHLPNNRDLSHLGHLDNRRNLRFHLDPRKTDYSKQELEGDAIRAFLDMAINPKNSSYRPRISETQLGTLCKAVSDECETVNGNVAGLKRGFGWMCGTTTTAFAYLIKKLKRFSSFLESEVEVAVENVEELTNAIELGNVGQAVIEAEELGESIEVVLEAAAAAEAAAPVAEAAAIGLTIYEVVTGFAMVTSCGATFYMHEKSDHLQDCKNSLTNCINTNFYDRVRIRDPR